MTGNPTNKDTNIVSYRKKGHFNIGMFLFGIIFIYLVVMVIIYLTANRTTPYEVRVGNIMNDKAYTGIAIRKEKLYYAEDAGYINYYSKENRKVKVGAGIYATSGTKLPEMPTNSSKSDSKKNTLSSDQQASIGMSVQSFADDFSDEAFSQVYTFKNAVMNSVSSISNTNKAAYLDELRAKDNSIDLTRSTNDGIIVYSADGYESLKQKEVTMESFDRTNYQFKEFYDNMKVSAGDPVYKLVTSEDWSVVVPISKETNEALQDKKSVRVRFAKDNETLIARLTIKNKNNQYFAYLNFNTAMIRYVGERFLDLELILEAGTGLKIPKSALVKKPFYIVPTEYLTQGGNSNQKGVLRKTKNKKGEEDIEFINTTIYYTKGDMAYIDPDELSEGDVLLKPESTMTYTVSEQRKLDGVYNINKGYAVFKQIEILCESDEYYIVEAGNDYGLANYDHIALNSKNVKENDIITQ